jgi:hypothetical protein
MEATSRTADDSSGTADDALYMRVAVLLLIHEYRWGWLCKSLYKIESTVDALE